MACVCLLGFQSQRLTANSAYLSRQLKRRLLSSVFLTSSGFIALGGAGVSLVLAKSSVTAFDTVIFLFA